MMTYLLFLCWIIGHFHRDVALPDVIRIGGIFDKDEKVYQRAFKAAIQLVNKDDGNLPDTRLLEVVEEISPNDIFDAERKVCAMLSSGVFAIFGPQTTETSNHVQSICDAMGIPHVETHWDFSMRRRSVAINIYPHVRSLGVAYKDLVNYYQWAKFAILYENDQGFIRLQDLLQNPIKTNHTISAHRLPEGGDYRRLLRSLKRTNYRNVIIDCGTRYVHAILKQIQQVGMMTSKYNYILTTLDLDLVDVEDFKYSDSNITAFRLVDPNHRDIRKIKNIWSKINLEPFPLFLDEADLKFTTEVALMFDAVKLFARGIVQFSSSKHIATPQLSCDSGGTWSDGEGLINFMKTIEITELSGLVAFETNGFRSRFNLDVVEVTHDGVERIGNWTNQKLKIHGVPKIDDEVAISSNNSIKNKNVTVTVILTAPYVILKNTSHVMSGNDRYEGFCIDLLDRVASILEFNYTIHEVRDGKYGTYDKVTKKYNGMIREVMDGEADLAIGDVTITAERERGVDFTLPFMNLGISILYKRPKPQPPNLLSFLSPFSLGVWLLMAGSYICVSVIMFALARLSPTEWDNPFPCIQDPDSLQNSFRFLNSTWFTIGSLMQQGSDIAPKANSTRMVAAIWYFFTLIMISSYTANLAAFLTFEQSVNPFNNVDELAAQTKIKYGAVGTGSTFAFFRDSKIEKYQKMFKHMTPDVMVSKNDEGVQRVKQRKDYAFLLESTGIEYTIERECDVAKIGGLIDNKGYGIALKEGSPYRSEISSVILMLHEKEEISKLKEKWWKHKGGGKCITGGSTTAQPLKIANVGGIFVVLLSGMGVACIVAVIEFLLQMKSIPPTHRGTIGSELCKEIVSALQCKNKKPNPVHKDTGSENGTAVPLSEYGFN